MLIVIVLMPISSICKCVACSSDIVRRELDRERGALERQEKKLILDIKKMAKTGQMVCLHMT